MATRKERVDNLLSTLVAQLERAGQRPDGFTAAEAGVLLALHKQQVGGDTEEASSGRFSDAERQVIHDLARGVGEGEEVPK
jgi:hypothetical protein